LRKDTNAQKAWIMYDDSMADEEPLARAAKADELFM
jgi:hypothetical protein